MLQTNSESILSLWVWTQTHDWKNACTYHEAQNNFVMALTCLFQPTMCVTEGLGPAVWWSHQ